MKITCKDCCEDSDEKGPYENCPKCGSSRVIEIAVDEQMIYTGPESPAILPAGSGEPSLEELEKEEADRLNDAYRKNLLRD